MSQLSPQDLQSLQQLIGVIAPKIIERLKACEATVASMADDITDLQEQVKVLHAAAAKGEKPKRGSKKKELEVPQLLPGSETAALGVPPADSNVIDASFVEVTDMETIESPLARTLHQTGVDANVGSSASGSPVAGTAAVVQNVASVPAQASPVGGLAFPVIDGVQVTGQLIYGTQYIMQQGFTDPAVIAQSLQTLPSVVQTIMNMSVAEQAALLELAQQGGAA